MAIKIYGSTQDSNLYNPTMLLYVTQPLIHVRITATLQFSSTRNLLQAARTNVKRHTRIKELQSKFSQVFSMFHNYISYLFIIVYYSKSYMTIF